MSKILLSSGNKKYVKIKEGTAYFLVNKKPIASLASTTLFLLLKPSPNIVSCLPRNHLFKVLFKARLVTMKKKD